MTETFHQVQFTEDATRRIDGDRKEFKEDEKIAVTSRLANILVNKSQIASYTGEKREIEDADGRIIRGAEEADGSSDDNGFDFEEYVENHNVEDVVEDVEKSDSVTWLENLRNTDDRKTVQSAVDERIEELEG